MWAVPLQVFIMYGALVPKASVNAYGCELKCCTQNNRMEGLALQWKKEARGQRLRINRVMLGAKKETAISLGEKIKLINSEKDANLGGEQDEVRGSGLFLRLQQVVRNLFLNILVQMRQQEIFTQVISPSFIFTFFLLNI